MKDTPNYILQKQFDIIHKQSNSKKLMKSLDLMKLSYEMAYRLIKKQYPTLSHRQIIAKRFEWMHGKDFTQKELTRIKKHLETVSTI